MNGTDISQEYGRSIFNFQNDVLEVSEILYVTASADEELGGRGFERFPAGILIALPDGVDHFANRNPVGEQFVWIQIDLVLLYKTAERCDLSHTLDRFQRISQIPILYGTELSEILVAAFIYESVLVNPSYPGCVGSDYRVHPLRQ